MAHPAGTTFRPNGQQQTHYVFAHAGDEIPLHDHDFYHSTCVLRGSIRCYDSRGKSRIFKAKESTGFRPRVEHAIVALEDGTEIMNVTDQSARAVDQV